jgi:hypothetical protein
MRFFLALFVIAGLVAGYVLVRDKRAENRVQAWAQQVMPLLRPQLDGSLNLAAPALPDEANFFKLLYLLHEIEERDLEMRDIISRACTKLDVLGEKANLVQESLMQNYDLAKRYQIFDNPDNLTQLESGRPVPIRLSGWNGELCAVGQVVPPERAPEIANCLPNLILMPAAARDAQDGSMSALTQDHARILSRVGFLDRMTLDSILQIKTSVK